MIFHSNYRLYLDSNGFRIEIYYHIRLTKTKKKKNDGKNTYVFGKPAEESSYASRNWNKTINKKSQNYARSIEKVLLMSRNEQTKERT